MIAFPHPPSKRQLLVSSEVWCLCCVLCVVCCGAGGESGLPRREGPYLIIDEFFFPVRSSTFCIIIKVKRGFFFTGTRVCPIFIMLRLLYCGGREWEGGVVYTDENDDDSELNRNETKQKLEALS